MWVPPQSRSDPRGSRPVSHDGTELTSAARAASSGYHAVDRPGAASLEENDQTEPYRQQMVFEAFSGPAAAPVHEEAVLDVDGDDRSEHDYYDPEGREPAQETEYKAERSEGFADDYKDGYERGQS